MCTKRVFRVLCAVCVCAVCVCVDRVNGERWKRFVFVFETRAERKKYTTISFRTSATAAACRNVVFHLYERARTPAPFCCAQNAFLIPTSECVNKGAASRRFKRRRTTKGCWRHVRSSSLGFLPGNRFLSDENRIFWITIIFFLFKSY